MMIAAHNPRLKSRKTSPCKYSALQIAPVAGLIHTLGTNPVQDNVFCKSGMDGAADLVTGGIGVVLDVASVS